MRAIDLLSQTYSSAHWFVMVLAVAVAGALLFVFAAWLNRRWRR
ncbi:MAG TPA: hypothetical protein VLJ39_20320 [Tepidisphaeraceae bacterium]|jgi:hypothetical protein|nr:hypothetical protein [Tepidisphaeraceae bacterium]